MCPQIACPRRWKITQAAFVWLFSTVRFQVWPQIAFLKGCIITQVAFVCLFSTVHFQMCPQIACLRRCIITQVAFVWYFPVFIGNSFTEILLHWIIMLKVLFHRHKWKGLSPVAVSFKLRKFNMKFSQVRTLLQCWSGDASSKAREYRSPQQQRVPEARSSSLLWGRHRSGAPALVF